MHPGGGTSEAWARVAQYLIVRFRVLRFDRRPYSVLGDVEATATMENEVNDCLLYTSTAQQTRRLTANQEFRKGLDIVLDGLEASLREIEGSRSG